ncbi:MAG: hypothetical protein AB7Q42_22425, partial [Acidimicrobiia bacterium]
MIDVADQRLRDPHSSTAWIAAVVASVACGLLVLFATRRAPQLSPDSMTYLSAAEHLRSGAGLNDFTGEPLTVFPPLYPLVLAVGGTSLVWVRIVGALAVAAATLLMSVALRERVRPVAALAGACAFGASQGLVRVASAAWSEAPYAAVSLGMIVLLGTVRMTPRRAALGGLVAGLGFLTRYGGAGLVLTGLTMVVVGSGRVDARRAIRSASAYCAVAGVIAGGWVVRNLVRTGEALGPRFEGGAGEDLATLVGLPLRAVGELVVGERPSDTIARIVGVVAIVALGAAAVVSLRRRPVHPLDAGMVVFAVTSLFIPVVARALTANDIEYRVMSPMLISLVYAGTIVVDRAWHRNTIAIAGASLASISALHGAVIAVQFPDQAHLSTGNRALFAPALFDAVDELPADVTVLTNYPQGLWWQTRREPTLFAFTRPRPGNSHVPLTLDETVEQICAGPTFLAWFAGLRNAGEGPAERRPEIVDVVDLVP